MNTTEFEKQFKTWLTEWKLRFEEMQVQFNLGKMDAADAFEKQKDKLKEFITAYKETLDKQTASAEDFTNKLRPKLDELWLQLNLGKAETRDIFETQRKKIESALHEIYTLGKESYDKNFNYAINIFDNNTQAFKTTLEILQLQYNLMKMDLRDGADEARKELNTKVNDFFAQAEKNQQLTVENINHFNKQLRENYDKMNNWLKSFINRE